VVSDLATLVAERRRQATAETERPDPPERIAMRGAIILDRRDRSVATVPEIGTRRQGVACAPGTLTGIARVISDPRRQSLAAGEILVARHTDPGWIVLFAAAGAVVVERGSLLSHSAIVSRELGIPCVVGLKGATGWILDGQRIRVDGASGVVEVIDG
jgi:pyruvate,water dikinase